MMVSMSRRERLRACAHNFTMKIEQTVRSSVNCLNSFVPALFQGFVAKERRVVSVSSIDASLESKALEEEV